MGDSNTSAFVGQTIAGGGSGIGLAIALALNQRGAVVYVADIAQQSPLEFNGKENMHFYGGCDVASRQACRAFLDTIPGRLDGLVNSAGICPTEGKMATDEQYGRIMAVNVTGTWNMGTEAIIRMSQQEDKVEEGLLPGTIRSIGKGSIVNIASGSGLRGIPRMAAYSASKHAVCGLTRSWSKDWPMVKINAVAPGVVDTPLIRKTTDSDPANEGRGKLATQLAARSIMGRMAYATDIADAALFLLSGAASFVTGQVVPVNGGSD